MRAKIKILVIIWSASLFLILIEILPDIFPWANIHFKCGLARGTLVSLCLSSLLATVGFIGFGIMTMVMINRRLRVEEELMKFKFMNDHANDAVFLSDKEGKFIYVNMVACEKMGYTEKELLSLSVQDVDETYDKAKYVELFDRVQKEKVSPFDSRNKKKNGDTFFSEISVSGLTVDGKKYLLAILRDITEKVRINNGLQKINLEWDAIFNAIGSSICHVDKEGRIIKANKAFGLLVGEDVKDVIGELCCDLVHGKGKRIEGCPFDKMKETGLKESVEIAAGGKWLEIVAHPVFNGQREFLGAIHVITDITRRKEIETVIRSTKDFYDTILANINEGVWVSDKDDVIIYANNAMEAIAGVGKVELLGASLFRDFSIATAKEFKPVYLTAKDTLKPKLYHMIEVLTPAGRRGYQSGWVVPKIKDGKFDGAICTVRDVTDEKYAEERTKTIIAAETKADVEAQKAEEIRKAYEALKEAQGQLVQAEKLSSIGILASGVAHELSTPLTGLVSILRTYSKNGDKAKLEAGEIKLMLNAAEYMVKIIRDLVEFANPSRGEVEEIDLSEAVESTLSFGNPKMASKKIDIRKEYSPVVKKIKADKRHIQQIVLNLLTNACDAIEHEGVITIRTRCSEDLKWVELDVQDTGMGIAKENILKIFDPFFSTKKDKGSGLGLAVAHGIISRYGGAISVESEPGKGTLFRIKMPAY